MKEEEFKTLLDSMQEKIGKEASGIIADDIGKLITYNTENNNRLKSKDNEIQTLKDTNEKLVLANGNLLKQVPVASDYEKHRSKEEESETKKSFNFMSAFDEKGHFKR